MGSLAIIGGTGVARMPGFERERELPVATPWGEASQPLQQGRLGGVAVSFLARHGPQQQRLAPHKINYRANLWALRESGAEQIIAINAVGGLRPDLRPGQLLIPDQIIDYTWGREHTYYDGSDAQLEHIDFTRPYDKPLAAMLARAASTVGAACIEGGTYAVTQGPRLESAAEVRRLRRDGADVVGMTGMPEAGLARELGLAYASLCIVVNPGAGLTGEPITEAAMQTVLAEAATQVSRLLSQLLAQ